MLKSFLTKHFPKNGLWGWGLLAGVVLIYDVAAITLNTLDAKERNLVDVTGEVYETLSGHFWRRSKKRKSKIVNLIIITVVVKHLAAPEFLRKADPIHLIGALVRIASK